MRIITKELRLPRLLYYETHLSLVNCLFPRKLTPMEIKVLASFMALEGDIAQYRFGPTAKKVIMQQLDISPGGLSNYIVALTKRGALKKVGDSTTIWPLLVPEDTEQYYNLKLINT